MSLSKPTTPLPLTGLKLFMFVPSDEEGIDVLRIIDPSSAIDIPLDRQAATRLVGGLLALLSDLNGDIPMDDVLEGIRAAAFTAGSKSEGVEFDV